MNRIIKLWLNRISACCFRFAMIETEKAVYDRVAIIQATPICLNIEYPKKVKSKWMIMSEKIAVRDIVKGKYYTN